MVAKQLTDDRPLTIEDLDLIPDDGNRYEIMQGELIVSPAPNDTHQLVLGRLHVALVMANTTASFGSVRLGPRDIKLTEHNIVEPDLLAYRTSQRALSNERFFDGAPAFVVEIDSPFSGPRDRVRKADLYMSSGVEEYWVVEPDSRRILVHLASRKETNPEIVTVGLIGSSIVPGFVVSLHELFAPEFE